LYVKQKFNEQFFDLAFVNISATSQQIIELLKKRGESIKCNSIK